MLWSGRISKNWNFALQKTKIMQWLQNCFYGVQGLDPWLRPRFQTFSDWKKEILFILIVFIFADCILDLYSFQNTIRTLQSPSKNHFHKCLLHHVVESDDFQKWEFCTAWKKRSCSDWLKKKTDVTGFWSNDVNQAHQSEPTPTNQEKHIFLHIFFTVVSHIPNIWLLVDWVKMKKIFFYCFLFLRIAFLFYKDFRIRSAHAERVKN